jgi:hypothetical protein
VANVGFFMSTLLMPKARERGRDDAMGAALSPRAVQ